jgi:dolichol-phosphate mannosyltransferase
MLRMAAAGLLNFSLAPLRLIGAAGLVLLAAALLYGLAALILWPLAGASLVANLVMLAVGLLGAHLCVLGLMAEYIGRTYEEARGRPIYIVRDAVGFDAAQPPSPAASAPARAAPPAHAGRIRLFT